MKKLCLVLCGLMLAFAACADTASDEGAAESAEAQTVVAGTIEHGAGLGVPAVQTHVFGATTAATTCTITEETACVLAKCELGERDRVSHITEVCCTDAGVCTTTRYRVCGC